ncbi:MAG TPA: DUF3618 domain-containing protein [Pyrinomonadaceae bacterium]|nr:DUF3618 domain-containing protein [Pyrinomonadaceae bacterium]
MAQERDNVDVNSETRETEHSDENREVDLRADAGGGDETGETEQIKEQIEETRNQMGETIDAIQEKLSFTNLSEQVTEHVNHAVETAKDAVYDATIGKAADIMKNIGDEITNSSIIRTAKDNPLPFVLIGLGAGLLAYQSYSGKQGGGRRRQLASGRDAFGRIGDGNYKGGRQPDGEGAVGEKVNGVTSVVSNAAGTAYDKVTSAVDSAVTGVSDAASQAYSKVGDVGTAARGKYDYYLEENPLAVGAVALALGAAVGFAIPETRYEEQLLGPARQDFLEKAQNTASDLIDKTKEVVTEAGRTVTEQAKAAIAE